MVAYLKFPTGFHRRLYRRVSTPLRAGAHDLWIESADAPETLRADLGQSRLVIIAGTSLEQASLNQVLFRMGRALHREQSLRAVA